MEFHMINITYVALHMPAETETRLGLQCRTPLRPYRLSLIPWPFNLIPYPLSLVPSSLFLIPPLWSLSPRTVTAPLKNCRWGFLSLLLFLLSSQIPAFPQIQKIERYHMEGGTSRKLLTFSPFGDFRFWQFWIS